MESATSYNAQNKYFLIRMLPNTRIKVKVWRLTVRLAEPRRARVAVPFRCFHSDLFCYFVFPENYFRFLNLSSFKESALRLKVLLKLCIENYFRFLNLSLFKESALRLKVLLKLCIEIYKFWL